MELTARNVKEVFMDCLFKDGENTENHIPVIGIMVNVGFNPEKTKEHYDDIIDMLFQLPETFQKSKGGGWSFLQGCTTETGELWTGEHRTVEQLFMLGIAIEWCAWVPAVKETWAMLPGGMPYVMIRDR